MGLGLMDRGRDAFKAVAGLTAAGAVALLAATPSSAKDLLGQPTPGGIDLQPAASVLKHDAIWFHNVILLPIITLISLLVLGLIIWIAIRYNKKANPTPARWAHNTVVEVIWTVVPVLILVGISLFSFRLLFAYHDMPTPDLTLKATGNQWNWAYEYPDQGVPEYVSNMIPEDQLAAKGLPHSLYRLAADEPIVVPVGKVVRVLVTGADVIHAFALPAFGLKTDAVPGRVNETWFRAEREGIFYGQCSELCGTDHAFMPIEIHVVSQAEFAAWVVSKGGSMTPKTAAEAPGGTAAQVAAGPVIPAAPVSADAVAAGAAPVGAVTGSPAAGPSTAIAPAVAPATAPAAQ
ncbi:cytochrome c oxidase subunit II [soil metagenome]